MGEGVILIIDGFCKKECKTFGGQRYYSNKDLRGSPRECGQEQLRCGIYWVTLRVKNRNLQMQIKLVVKKRKEEKVLKTFFEVNQRREISFPQLRQLCDFLRGKQTGDYMTGTATCIMYLGQIRWRKKLMGSLSLKREERCMCILPQQSKRCKIIFSFLLRLLAHKVMGFIVTFSYMCNTIFLLPFTPYLFLSPLPPPPSSSSPQIALFLPSCLSYVCMFC